MPTKYFRIIVAFIMLFSLLPINMPQEKISAMYPDFWETSLHAHSTGYGINTGKGRINLTWSAKAGATGYNVLVFNGREYEVIDVGNANSWTTQGQKLWPTPNQILLGEYKIRLDGTGGEFADDPRPVYRNAGQEFGNQRYYSFKVTAYNEQGAFATTEAAITSITDQTAPSIPTGLRIENPLFDQYTVAWEPSVDSDSKAIEYRINVGTVPGANDVTSGLTAQESYKISNLFPRMTYYVHVIARDESGNYSDFSAPLEIKPRRQVDAVLVNSSMQTNLQTNSQTTAMITFRNEGVEAWTARDGFYLINSQVDFPLSAAKVFLSENETIQPGGSKTFSFPISAGNQTGTYDANWSMTKEGVGTFGSSLSRQFKVADTQKPIFDFYKTGDTIFAGSRTVNLGFFVTDSSNTFFKIKNENSAWSDYISYTPGMTQNWTLSEGEGSKTVSIMFKDEYGNEAEPKSKTFQLDTIRPVVNITSPANEAYFDGTINIAGTASDLNIKSYTLYYGQGENPLSWTKIVSGNTSITNKIIGAWNTTSLQAGKYTLKLEAIDKANNSSAIHRQVWVKPKTVHRIGGANRFKVEENFNSYIPDHSLDTVILASGLNFPDALSGGPLNQSLNGTLLLVSDHDSVIKDKLEQAKRLLKPGGKVLILGGTASVSVKVESQFNRLFPVERIGGRNRQEVSVKVADRVNPNPEEIFLSWGLSFADSLSVVPHATKTGTPIILQVGKDKLDTDVKSYIQKKNIKKITIVSGTGVITPKIEEELRLIGIKDVQRIAGKDRFETSLKIAKAFYPDAKKAAFSNGMVFADALSGSRFAFTNNMPILLVKKDSVPESVSSFLSVANTRDFYLYGGEGTIAPIVVENLLK